MTNLTVVWYRGKKYRVILRYGDMLFIRRDKNPLDSRWVHKDVVMELTDE